MFRLCSELTSIFSLNPNSSNIEVPSIVLTSILLITKITFLLLFLMIEAISLSYGDMPNFLSTTNKII